tara:strand:+ start:21489 stop:22073 length:585 start_codon:yes stop_codon:yes gene_type:complete
MENEILKDSFCPTSKEDWRKWLEKNHIEKDSIWLILHKKSSDKPSISWSDTVDVALCYGWIDSTKKTLDNERYTQYYGKRKAKSTWSKINKDKVEVLKKQNLMKPAGLECIKVAKENGSWSILDEVENLEIPVELDEKFKTNPDANAFYLNLSKSKRKSLLQWIVMAKRPETKTKRINEIVELAGNGLIPKQFR